LALLKNKRIFLGLGPNLS